MPTAVYKTNAGGIRIIKWEDTEEEGDAEVTGHSEM